MRGVTMISKTLFLFSCLLFAHHLSAISEFVLQSLNTQPNSWQATQQFIQSHVSFAMHESSKPHMDAYAQFVRTCKTLSADDYAYFFNYHVRSQHIDEQQILVSHALYQYMPFQAYIRTLPGYQACIAQLYEHIDCGKRCKQRVQHIVGLSRDQFKQIVKTLHQELQNVRKQKDEHARQVKRQEASCKEQEKQRACIREQQQAVMAQQHEQLVAISAAWQDMTDDEDVFLAGRYRLRSNAVASSVQDNAQWYEQSYAVGPAANKALADGHMSADTFGMLYGTALQHVLHKEFVTVIDDASYACDKYQHISAVRNLGNTVIEFADIGREYNRHGAVVQASELADFCWVALDCIKAIGEGFCEGVEHTVDMVLHPVETVTNIVKGVGLLAYQVGHMVHEVTELAILLDANYHAAEKKFDDMVNRFDLVLQAIQEKQKELELRDYCKGVAAFATEWYLQARLIRGLGTLYESAQKQVPKLVSKFGDYMPDKKVLLGTPEGVQFEVAREAQDILQRSVAIGVPMGEAASSCLTEFLFSVEKEIIQLRQLFDCTRKGFGEFANKFIKIDYQHILGIELRAGKKGAVSLGGFHHDFMGAIEKGGVFDFVNVVKSKSGFYSADVIVNGRSTYKTFFPQNWPREKVISKIYEAFDNCMKSGMQSILQPNGNYKFQGHISEGVKIEMFITKTGQIKTAYPIIKGV